MRKMKHKKLAALTLAALMALMPMSVLAEETSVASDPAAAEKVLTEAQIDLKQLEVDSLTEADLQEQTQVAAPSRLEAIPQAADLQVAELGAEKPMTFSKASAPAASADGIYLTDSFYLTETGDSELFYPLLLEDGHVLHVQVDMPDNAQLDYDVYLFEVDANLDLTMVDYSEYSTYINGTNGTLSEAVGAKNASGVAKEYAVLVQSYNGGSINQPFTIHIAIYPMLDNLEVDENADFARAITMATDRNTPVTSRAIDTVIDNDWFILDSSGSPIDQVEVTLDSVSVAAGYKVEVYTRSSSNQMIRVPISNNKFRISGGTYYIRVSSAVTTVTGQNYTLNLIPHYDADQVIITEILGGFDVTYPEGTRYRVEDSVTVKGVVGGNGFLLPNAQVTVTAENDAWTNPSYRYSTATVTTDSNGAFTAIVNLAPSYASRSYYLYGAIDFIHYYDIGWLYAESGSGFAGYYPLYIFAYSIYVG